MMVVSLRGNVLAAGQIRRLWRQSVDLIPAQGSFSWTRNSNSTDSNPGIDITRALRYMTRSLYAPQGVDNTRYANLHSAVPKRTNYKTVTTGAGQKRYAPTVRNRLTSFGSRVPTLNQQIVGAQPQ